MFILAVAQGGITLSWKQDEAPAAFTPLGRGVLGLKNYDNCGFFELRIINIIVTSPNSTIYLPPCAVISLCSPVLWSHAISLLLRAHCLEPYKGMMSR